MKNFLKLSLFFKFPEVFKVKSEQVSGLLGSSRNFPVFSRQSVHEGTTILSPTLG